MLNAKPCVVHGRLGDVSNEDLAIVKSNQFTNLIEWLFQLNKGDENCKSIG